MYTLDAGRVLIESIVIAYWYRRQYWCLLVKRAARIILKADFRTRSVDMFRDLGWQSIENRLMYNKAILTYKALNNETPEYVSKLLKPVSQTYGLNLRSSQNGDLHVPSR